MKKLSKNIVQKLDGANMDIDLTTSRDVSWKQDKCPWNKFDEADKHKCAIKNVSICPYFCGIEYLDNVLCCYPHKNTAKDNKIKDKFAWVAQLVRAHCW